MKQNKKFKYSSASMLVSFAIMAFQSDVASANTIEKKVLGGRIARLGLSL